MKHIHDILLRTSAIASLLLPMQSVLTSCSCDSGTDRSETVSTKVRDKKAYHLGEEHAERLLEKVNNESAVQDELLDIRARISNIHSKLGAQSAADYERGFTDYIRANNDSLAAILF